MQAEIKGKNLVITIPLLENAKVSASGKTIVVATTSGFFPSTAQINGKPVRISVNAIIGRD